MAKRDALPSCEKQDLHQKIRKRVLDWPLFQKARDIFFYCSKGSEVDTRILIKDALSLGKHVSLPISLPDGGLEVSRIFDLESDCELGLFGIDEPKKTQDCVVDVDDIEIFLIPGIAFDLAGHRLGWGRGFFDRFLAALKSDQLKVGLSYETQMTDLIRAQEHDVRMDWVVTDQRVIDCHQ